MPDAASDAGAREAAVLDRIAAFRRRRPRLTDEVVTLAHGAGGKASAALVDAVFLDAFLGAERGALGDAAVVGLPGGDRLAFSTDSYVVSPRRFPGGSIGHLAVHGTVNDVAVQGGRPTSLTAAFVIEEGFPIEELRAIVADMAEAAAAAGVARGRRRHEGRRNGRRRRPVHLDGRHRTDPGGTHARARARAAG